MILLKKVLNVYFTFAFFQDIIFNFEKAYFILDELLMAGEMQVKYAESCKAKSKIF